MPMLTISTTHWNNCIWMFSNRLQMCRSLMPALFLRATQSVCTEESGGMQFARAAAGTVCGAGPELGTLQLRLLLDPARSAIESLGGVSCRCSGVRSA